MQKKNPTLSNLNLSLSLFCLLLSIYYLTYSGTYITDDEHILTSRTLSMAYDPRINDDRVLGNSRVFSYSSLPPIVAAQGLNTEPVQAYLGSLLAKLALYFNFGHVQTIYLLNIFFTALTAVILFWTVLLSGYSKLTSYSLGIIFGICTIVWPYTRTYFRDPIAMFFLTMSWGAYRLLITERSKNRPFGRLQLIYWIILIFSLTIGILSKNSVMFVIPVITISLIIEGLKFKAANTTKMIPKAYWAKGFIALGLFLTLIFIWIKLMPISGVFSRFTFAYYQTVIHNFISNPHPNLIQAILGPILSPGKSIFIFSPILIISFIALLKYFRQAWPAWLYFLFLITGQGLFYDADWFGYINWGLRYLIPAIPLLLIASAPIVDNLLMTKKGQLKLLLLGSLSLFMQLIGILAPVKQYYISMANSNPSISYTSMIWNPKFTAIYWHLKWIFSGENSDLAISRVGSWSFPLVLILLVLISCSLIIGSRYYPIQRAAILLLVTVLSSGIMLSIFRFDPANRIRSDLTESQKMIQQYHSEDDIIIIKSYGTQARSYWMNWAEPELKWVSLPLFFPNQYSIDRYLLSKKLSDALNSISQQILQEAKDEYERVWLVIPSDSPGSNFNWEARYLAQDGILLNYWFFSGDGNITRLYLFDSNRK